MNPRDRRPVQFRAVEYMFEATSFERSRLHIEWRGAVKDWDERPTVDLPTVVWVGELAGQPVVVLFTWVRLAGHLVGFYEATSSVVDHKMVEDYIDRNFCPPSHGTERRKNASNFKNGLLDLRIL